MFKFFHHLLNPHCEDCRHDLECPSCETLKTLLDAANYEKKQLLNTILELTNPERVAEVQSYTEPKPVTSKFIPWEVRRRMLEEESRVENSLLKKKAEELKEAAKSTVELEKELGING